MNPPFLPANKLAFLLLCLSCLWSACTDPIGVGSELLESDRTEVGEFTDVPFTTRVVRDDSTFTFDGSSFRLPSAFTFGRLEDEVFGTTEHSVYLTPRLPRTASGLPVVPGYTQRVNIDIDSIVLIVPIDTARAFYGPGRTFPIRATTITAPVSFSENFFSNVELPTDGIPINEQSTVTVSETPRLVRDTAVAGPALVRPHLRIRMNQTLVERFNRLRPEDFGADSLFRQEFAGIYLEPDGESEALLGLRPIESSNEDTLYNGLAIYYRDTSGRAVDYTIRYLQALPNYRYAPEGSLAGDLLEEETNEELLAVVGQSGLMVEIAFGDLSSLQDRVVNRAVLDIPVLSVEGYDYARYPPPSRVELLWRPTPTSSLLFIEESARIRRIANSQTGLDLFVGGRLRTTEDGLRLYSPNFGVHLQRILDGEVPPRLYLRVTPAPGGTDEFLPARALLAGPEAPDGPQARMRITFTELD